MAHNPRASYRIAPVVAAGDRITSTQAAQQADSVNDRILSGYADAVRRRVILELNAVRQFRNPSGSQFPPQAEWFHIYQHLDPKYSDAQYPEADPGEEEGANLATIINQFVFGNSFLDSEDNRINDPVIPILTSGQGAEYKWNLGKYQRGAITSDGQGNTPALSAAISGFYISSPYSSPHGKTVGGFIPTPTVLLSDCGTTDDDGLNIRSYEIKFTALQSTVSAVGKHGSHLVVGGVAVVTYAGSCPDWTANTATDHVWGIAESPIAYFVLVNPGFIDVYLKSEWIEGPYDGNGMLYRNDALHVSRFKWAYVSDKWRGTEAQRTPDTYKIKDIAFDFQAAFEQQWRLSPARGVVSGASIEAIYPTASFVGSSISENGFMTWTPGGKKLYHRFNGYVFTGLFFKAAKLFEPCTVEILDDADAVIQTVEISPDDNGDAADVIWFPTASSTTSIQARVRTGARFTAADGTLTIEVAELSEYKPEYWDLYLLIRLMTTEGGDDLDLDTIDGATSEAFAKNVWENFARWGVIYNDFTAGVRTIRNAINTNPVYEAFRKISSSSVKIARRQEFLSYEVSGGKSILRFKRWAYGLFNSKADMWKDLAPSFEPASEIIEGEEYVVRATSGFVTYRGQNFAHGQRFIGAADYPTFQTQGDANPFVYDGIKSVALKKGYTNEWCGFIATHAYHPSESSIWKLDAYADYYPFNERCHFYANPARFPRELFRHINVNYIVSVNARADGTGYDIENDGIELGSILISPESMTGWRYALGANATSISDDFCKSCRIYEPPFEIESCIIEPDMIAGGRNDVVKITLKSRLQFDEVNAPAAVSADVSAWATTEKDNLRTIETYRTDDNALREYCRYVFDGVHGSWKIGDSAADSSVQLLPDNPFGSIMPHFYFAKLVPKPYEDDNDVLDSDDSRMTIDAARLSEVWLASMCEGFIDGFSTEQTVCAGLSTNQPYDFTWTNACFRAFGGSDIGAFGLSVRPDEPKGHGPLPNTIAYADVFNRISEVVNLFYMARLDLPVTLQSRVTSKDSAEAVGAFCVQGAGLAIEHSGCPPVDGTVTVGAWTDGLETTVAAGGGFDKTAYCLGGAFNFVGGKTSVQIRYKADSPYIYAIPPDAYALIQGGSIALYGHITQTTITPYKYSVTPPDGQECAPGVVKFTGNRYDETTVVKDLGCQNIAAFSFDSGRAPCGDFYFGSYADASSGAGYSPCGNTSLNQITIDEAMSASPPILVVPMVAT